MTKQRIAVLTSLGVILGLEACVAARPAPPSKPSFYQSLAAASASVDSAMARDMISAYRRNNGLGPLTLDPDLQRFAEQEAAGMAGADRPGAAEVVKARVAAAGFRSPAVNLSAGYHTLAEAFSGWRDSPEHKRVLLDRSAGRMGIATAYAPHSKYKVYWALVVAAPETE